MAAAASGHPAGGAVSAIEQFGAAMKHVRARRGLSIKGAAATIDGKLSHVTISRVERGDRDPQLSTIVQLCRAYDVDVVVKRDGTIDVRGSGIKVSDENELPPKEVL